MKIKEEFFRVLFISNSKFVNKSNPFWMCTMPMTYRMNKISIFFEMRQFLPQSSLTKNNLLHPVCRWLKTKTIAFDKMFRFFFCLYCSIQTNDFTNNNNRPKKITINLNLFYEIYLFIIIYYYCWFSHSHPVCTASHHCKCLSHLYNIRV